MFANLLNAAAQCLSDSYDAMTPVVVVVVCFVLSGIVSVVC